MAVWGFWTWQCLWIGILFLRMTGADSYDGLFALQSVLDEWNGSFLVRVLYSLIQGSRWLPAITGMDVCGLLLTFLYFSAGLKKWEWIWGLSFVSTLVFAGLMAWSCFSLPSLMEVADRLRMTGIAGSAFILILLAFSVYSIAWNAHRLS